MRIVDAYRRKIITSTQYNALLDSGNLATDVYLGTTIVPEQQNAWIEAFIWQCEGIGAKAITIKNSDVNYDLEYKINTHIATDYPGDIVEMTIWS